MGRYRYVSEVAGVWVKACGRAGILVGEGGCLGAA